MLLDFNSSFDQEARRQFLESLMPLCYDVVNLMKDLKESNFTLLTSMCIT